MVIFFDIDGTIVDDGSQIIPESTAQAIATLRRHGHLSVVNTGRPYGHIDPRVRALDFGAWVCGCGMQVILDGRFLHRDYPSHDVCRHAVEQARKYGMLQLCESETEVFYDTSLPEHTAPAREAARMRQKGFCVRDIRETEYAPFVKFITNDGDRCDRDGFIRSVATDWDVIYRDGDLLEFVKKGNSKARGMEILLSALGVRKEDTFAIGDSTNDLPMFRAAGTTICMGGGMEELRLAADHVTDTVLNDGIAKALKHFELI